MQSNLLPSLRDSLRDKMAENKITVRLSKLSGRNIIMLQRTEEKIISRQGIFPRFKGFFQQNKMISRDYIFPF